MNILLDWSDLDGRRLPDGDRIESTISSPIYSEDDPRRLWLIVRIELGPGIRWWKQVELTDIDRRRLAQAEAQDDTTSDECHANAVPARNPARWMVLWKAKTAGVHTPMYDLTDLDRMAGKYVLLRWTRD